MSLDRWEGRQVEDKCRVWPSQGTRTGHRRDPLNSTEPVVNNTALCTRKLVKRVDLIVHAFNIHRHPRRGVSGKKLLETMDMSVTSIVMMVSWAFAYLQTVYINRDFLKGKKKQWGILYAPSFSLEYVFEEQCCPLAFKLVSLISCWVRWPRVGPHATVRTNSPCYFGSLWHFKLRYQFEQR